MNTEVRNQSERDAPQEETWLGLLRRQIEEQYEAAGGTGCGTSFGELLCYELHSGRTFVELAERWTISLPDLGDLIADHCRRMQQGPRVKEVRRAYV